MADQTYGGFWVRVLAYLVDSVVIFSAIIVLAFVAAFLGEIGMTLIPVLAVLTPTLYWALMQASARQATLGKALLGMKVTDTSGNRISLLRSLGRELAKIVSGIPLGLGYVMAAFTGRKQALHDMVAATIVTRESPGHVLIAVLVGVFGWIMPAGLAMFIGGALIAVMMGTMGAGMLGQTAQDGRKNIPPAKTAAAPPAQPAPKPAASTPPPAPTPAAAPAPSAPPAAPAPSVSANPEIEVALKARLEGFDNPGTAKAGPAVLEYYPSLGSRLRLKSYLPPMKELEGSRLAINVTRIQDAKGVELSDENIRMGQGSSLLHAEYEPVRVLSGMHVIQLKGGTNGEAAARVEGVLIVNVPTSRTSASFSAGNVRKPQNVGGVQISLREIKGKDATFDFAGDAAKVVYAAGSGADETPVALETYFGKSDPKGGSMTYSFAKAPAKIELVVADRFTQRTYPFVLRKAGGQEAQAAKERQAAKVAAAPKPEAPPEEAKAAEVQAPPAAAPQPVIVVRTTPGPRYGDLMSAVMAADAAGVQELLAFGKWPDKPDSNGYTPLMVAAMRGDRGSAELLLKAGADPDRALGWSRQRGDPAMTSLLERYSATSKRP